MSTASFQTPAARVSTLASGLIGVCGTPVCLGCKVLVAETQTHKLRLLNHDGELLDPLAGTGQLGWMDGTSLVAKFDMPSDLAVVGERVVVSDTANNRLRLVHPDTGEVSTLAGSGEPGYAEGQGDAAKFNFLVGIAAGQNGDVIVADTGNHRIRLVNVVSGEVSTLAGNGLPGGRDGPAEEASFLYPVAVATLANGDVVVADTGNHKVRLIEQGSRRVSTIAGSGEAGHVDAPNGLEACFKGLNSIAVLATGDLAVADEHNNCVRLVKLHTEGIEVSTIAGSGQRGAADGLGEESSFWGPCGVGVLPNGDLVVADTGNHALRRIELGWRIQGI